VNVVSNTGTAFQLFSCFKLFNKLSFNIIATGPTNNIGIHSFDFALQVLMARNWIQEINLVSIFVYYAWYSKASKFNEQKYSSVTCCLLFT
jgi:hypothetical protein